MSTRESVPNERAIRTVSQSTSPSAEAISAVFVNTVVPLVPDRVVIGRQKV